MLIRTLVCLLVLGVPAFAAFAQEAVKTKIILVSTRPDHPWATHMYAHECRVLADCLRRNAGVETIVVEDWPRDPATLANVKSLVYYSRPAGDIVLSDKHRQQFEELMAEGVGYVAIHWATDADPKRGAEYLNVLGGWFNFAHSGLKITTAQLKQLAPEHPISRGWQEFPIHDEIYLNLKFHERAIPLVQISVDGREQAVAWSFERKVPPGKGSLNGRPSGGRSFGSTLGHFHDNFEVAAFRRLLVNGILWTAGVEVPKGGAVVEVPEAVLKLPPEPKAE